MAANPNFMDGELEYGSALLTITPKQDASPARDDLTNFEAIGDDTFTFNDNSERVMSTNQFGEPEKKFGIPQLKEGSCTVQLPSGRRAYPGDTFTTDVTGSTVWIVENVDHPYVKNRYRQQTISYSEKLN